MSEDPTVDATVPTVNVGRGNLIPFTSETAREASAKAARARQRKREEAEAAIATLEAANRGATVAHPDVAPITAGPIRTTLAKVCQQIGREAPWRDGDKAAAFLTTLAQLAAQEDRDAEARRQALLREAVAKPQANPAPSDALATLVAALNGNASSVGASEPTEAASMGPDGADDEATTRP